MPSTQRQERGYRALSDAMAGNGEACQEAAHEKVKVGAYYLGSLVIRELMNWKTKEDVTPEMLKQKTTDDGRGKSCMEGEAKLVDGFWYFGGRQTIMHAARVSFEELHPGPTSLVGVLVQTEKGWTFAPIKRPDAVGTGDSAAAEICGSCCISVKTLSYGDKEDDEKFKEDLKARPVELLKTEKKAFRHSQTAAKVNDEEYKIETDMKDLCCVGPCGAQVRTLMHWIGLEEEFLAVREKKMNLDDVMEAEGGEAANRHHMARIAGFLLLVLGSFMIIGPVVKMLNSNWIASLLGGALISAVLCCCACLCSASCFCLIVSTAWIAHRPFLASLGFFTAASIGAGVYYYVYMQEQEHKNAAPSAQAAFMATRYAIGQYLEQF